MLHILPQAGDGQLRREPVEGGGLRIELRGVEARAEGQSVRIASGGPPAVNAGQSGTFSVGRR
jgi:hypothetical protein